MLDVVSRPKKVKYLELKKFLKAKGSGYVAGNLKDSDYYLAAVRESISFERKKKAFDEINILKNMKGSCSSVFTIKGEAVQVLWKVA